MAITLTPETETRLREQASRIGQDAEAIECVRRGLADIEAGKTLSLNVAHAEFEAAFDARFYSNAVCP